VAKLIRATFSGLPNFRVQAAERQFDGFMLETITTSCVLSNIPTLAVAAPELLRATFRKSPA